MLETAFIVQSGEDSERKEESWRESLNLLREYLIMNRKLVEIWMVKNILWGLRSDEQHVTEIWKKSDPCCKVPKNFAELCLYFTVLWKVEFCEQ